MARKAGRWEEEDVACQRREKEDVEMTGILLVYKKTTLTLDSPGGVKVFPKEEVLTNLQVTIPGPEENPYAGGLSVALWLWNYPLELSRFTSEYSDSSSPRTDNGQQLRVVVVRIEYYNVYEPPRTMVLNLYTEEGVPDLIVDGCEPPCGCWRFELRTCGRRVSVLNLQAISPAPAANFYEGLEQTESFC
ncbi:hypothetical protein STEG23_024979 [Scotinomys teguina]